LLTHRRLLRSHLLRGTLLRAPLPASLLRTPRPVLAKRLALSVLCCATLSAAGFLPVIHPSSGAPSTVKAAAMGTDAADRGTRAASRDKQRTGSAPAAPSTASSSAAAQSAPAPAQSAAPAPVAAPAAPALPSIPGLDQYQVENAQTIVNVGTQMGVPTRGKVIAIATAMQESKLYNLDQAVDYDSLGLFQQRPSTGWGTPGQITTPSYAAQAFYARLMDTQDDWGCLSCAAQRVQGSAFPYAYAQWEGLADSVVAALGN
jgi:hypothetical protein